MRRERFSLPESVRWGLPNFCEGTESSQGSGSGRSSHTPTAAAFRAAPAVVLFKQDLPQADLRGRDLHQLVLFDELQGLFQRQPPGAAARGCCGRGPPPACCVSFFSLVGLTFMSLAAAVLAHDHALVDHVAGADVQFGPFLEAVQPEGHGPAAGDRNQHARGPRADLALHRLVALEAVVDDGRALRGVQEPRPQADQPARRESKRPCTSSRCATACPPTGPPLADQLHHRAGLVLGHFHHQRLERLFDHAVVVVEDHVRLADGQLEAFAAHGLDQDARGAACRGRKRRTARCRRSARRAGRRSSAAPSAAARGGAGW